MEVKAGTFLNVVSSKKVEPPTPSDEEKVEEIIQRYCNGDMLSDLLIEYGIKLFRFRYILSKNPIMLMAIEEAESFHREQIKHDLTSVLIKKAKSGETKSLLFALERMFPDEFGKKVEIRNEKTEEEDPKVVQSYIDSSFDESSVIEGKIDV